MSFAGLFDTERQTSFAVDPIRHERWLYPSTVDRHKQMLNQRRRLEAEDIAVLSGADKLQAQDPMMYGTPSSSTLDKLSSTFDNAYTYISRGEKQITTAFAPAETRLSTLNHTVQRLPTPIDNQLPVIEQLKRTNLLPNEHPSKQDLRIREHNFMTGVRVADKSHSELTFLPDNLKLFA